MDIRISKLLDSHNRGSFKMPEGYYFTYNDDGFLDIKRSELLQKATERHQNDINTALSMTKQELNIHRIDN